MRPVAPALGAEVGKLCPSCGENRPLPDFTVGGSRLTDTCRRCRRADGKQRYEDKRRQSPARVNRRRARQRAMQDLAKLRPDEFEGLLERRLAEAEQEAHDLAARPEAAEHYRDRPVNLRPGRRAGGEKAGDRIDVARCPHCVRHHDRGHRCPVCGTSPQQILRRLGETEA